MMSLTLFKQDDAVQGKPRDDEALMQLRVENVLSIQPVQALRLTTEEQQELKKTVASPLCSDFNDYLRKINELEISKISGVGLADSEKNHFNFLTRSIAENRPISTDTIPQIKAKVIRIQENNLLIAKYKSIINLYKAYLKILNDKDVWRIQGLEQVKSEWDTHRYFAACDSKELLSIYRLYTNSVESVVRGFTQKIDDGSVKTSPNVKIALQYYCRHVFQQMKEIQAQAIQSMLLRLRLAEQHRDIHFDDVISHTVVCVETVYGKRIIIEDPTKQDVYDEMRRWRRRGLGCQYVREFVAQIIKYCEEKNIEESEVSRRKTIIDGLNRLCFQMVPQGLNLSAIDSDPVLFFMIHQIDAMINQVKEKLTLEVDGAIQEAKDLENLISEACRVYESVRLVNRKFKNDLLEKKLEYCQRQFTLLLQCVHECLIQQVQVDTARLLKNAEDGNVCGMVDLQASKQKLMAFHEQYQDRLEVNDITLINDFLYHAVRHIHQNVKLLQSDAFVKTISTVIAQNHFWPIVNENVREYEASIRVLISSLQNIATSPLVDFSLDPYLHYNWMIFYLEEALPLIDFPIARHRQLARVNARNWVDKFPLARVVSTKSSYIPTQITDFVSSIVGASERPAEPAEIFIPEKIKDLLSSTAAVNPKSNLRRFLLECQNLFININSTAMYVLNVVIPYVDQSPFINLLSFSKSNRYAASIEHLIDLIGKLKDKAAAGIKDKSASTSNTKILLENLLTDCDDVATHINNEWESALFKNINVKFNDQAVTAYLVDNNNVINLKRVTALLNKIANTFQIIKYKELLIEKIQSVCAGILIDCGTRVLAGEITSSGLQNYVHLLTEISLMKSFGRAVISKVMASKNVADLIRKHLDKFDGSHDEIGGLIGVLYPAESAADPGVVEKFIAPYARKRLDHLRIHSGVGIQLSDVIFFDAYAEVAGCKDLFAIHHRFYNDEIISKLKENPQAVWEPTVARIVELFGSVSDRSWYRSKCLAALLRVEPENDKSARDALDNFQAFKLSLLRQDTELVRLSVQIPGENITFGELLNQYTDTYRWSRLRDNIISLFGLERAQIYHVRCTYQLLDNNLYEFGPWLEDNINNTSPADFLGEKHVVSLSDHILRLIGASYNASRDFNIEVREGEALLNLLANLKYTKVMLEKIGNRLGCELIADIPRMEKCITYAIVARKLLTLITGAKPKNVERGQLEASGASAPVMTRFNDKAIHELLFQLNNVFNQIEEKELVSLKNIRTYLTFIEKTLAVIFPKNIEATLDRFLIGLFNFYINLMAHFKKIISMLSKSSLVADSDSELLLDLASCIDENEKIDQHKDNILSGLDQIFDLKDVAEKFIDLSLQVNNATRSINSSFQTRLLREAGLRESRDNPVKLASVCVAHLAQSDDATLFTVPFLAHLIRTTINVVNLIPLDHIGEFMPVIARNRDAMEYVISVASKGDTSPLLQQSFFGQHRQLTNPLLDQFMLNMHKKYVCHLLYLNLSSYIFSKVKVNPETEFKVLCDLRNSISAIPEKDRATHVMRTLNINRDHTVRKILLLVELFRIVSEVYADDSATLDPVLECLGGISKEVDTKESSGQKSYYKAVEFKSLLVILQQVLRTKSVAEIERLVAFPKTKLKH